MDAVSFNARLGTRNNRTIHFGTNDTTRVRIDSLGRLQIRNMAGNGVRLVYVDSLGNMFARDGDISISEQEYMCNRDLNGGPTPEGPGGLPYLGLNDVDCPSRPCVANAGPWFEGGNKIGTNGDNRAGTYIPNGTNK